MKALGKTLFGDRTNVLVVLAILAVELALVETGLPRAAAYLMPVLLLGAAAALSRG